MVKLISTGVRGVGSDRYITGRGKNKHYEPWPTEGLTLEHIADKPMTFRTKKDLAQYCKKKGLRSGAIAE